MVIPEFPGDGPKDTGTSHLIEVVEQYNCIVVKPDIRKDGLPLIGRKAENSLDCVHVQYLHLIHGSFGAYNLLQTSAR